MAQKGVDAGYVCHFYAELRGVRLLSQARLRD